MPKKRHHQKRYKNRPLEPQAYGGFEAAIPSPDRVIPFWPTLDTREEVDSADLWWLWRTARWLYANDPHVCMAVQSIANLCGWLMPLPATEDTEWNRLAAAAFARVANNPTLFDTGHRLTWKTAQLWMEQRSVVDGDVLTVLRDPGKASVSFIEAPRLTGSGENLVTGVYLGEYGEAVGYNYTAEPGGQSVVIPAASAILYQQRPDAARPRGYSELAAAMTNIQDAKEIAGYLKISIKNAASFAIVEEKPVDDPIAARASAWQARKNARTGGNTENGAQPNIAENWAVVNGVKMTSLAPGRKLSILTDPRPSSQNEHFIERLINSLANAVGLDPITLYNPERLASASTRLILQKLSIWRDARLLQREIWANRVYQHIISREVAAGRLRPCRAAAWQNVTWIKPRDLSIDKGRDTTAEINLIREGLADANAWTLATEGLTVRQIIERRAADIRAARDIAEDYDIPLSDILPGALGASNMTATDAAAGADDAAVPAPLTDPEPEA